jgi:hypothetical protein
MGSRSHRVNHYGSEFEKWIAERRNLKRDGVHTAYHDLEFKNGVPVEAKAALPSTGYFQLYRQQHQELTSRGGYYAFGVYRPKGNDSGGIRVLKSVLKRASDIPIRAWSPTGSERGPKLKLPFGEVFA